MKIILTMRHLIIILFFTSLLVPSIAIAKRGPPPKIEPIIYDGVRYVAPNDDGRRAHVQAWDVKTNQLLWDLTIFHNLINPIVEEDVQWVLIKKLSVSGDKLIVVDELNRSFSVDLKTRSVKRQLINNGIILAALILMLGLVCAFHTNYVEIFKSEQKRNLIKKLGYGLIGGAIALMAFQILGEWTGNF